MLSILDVKTVYYVDDELNEAQPDQEAIMLKLLALSPEQQEKLYEYIPSDILSVPAQFKRRTITSFLSGLTDEERETLLTTLAKLLQVEIKPVKNDQAKFLETLFKGNSSQIVIHCLSPKEWKNQEQTAIEAASTSNRIFCLFDQNLGTASPLGSSSLQTGLGLIHSALRLDAGRDAVFCVLFTGDITGEVLIESELAYWSKSVADTGLASSQFFPLSKDRALSRKAFAEGIKLSALNAVYDMLRLKTVNMLQEAASEAKRKLDSIHLYNLHFMVSASSVKEGVWEADTLIRLHEILRKEYEKEQMVKDEFALFFNSNINKVADINKLLSYLPELPVDERYQLRRQELYETSTSLNKIHSELKTGDVFRATVEGGTQDFVLLAQPCDLVVRKNGRRKSVVATMAPIRIFANKEEYDAHVVKVPSYEKTVFPLECYTASLEGLAFVELNSLLTTEVKVLDLAVLSKEGRCAMAFGEAVQAPVELQRKWQDRFKELHKEFNSICQTALTIESIGSNLSQEERHLVLSLVPSPFTALSTNPTYRLPKPVYSAAELYYGLHRVASIRQPLATYLLDIHTKYLSRTAFDHDFVALETD